MLPNLLLEHTGPVISTERPVQGGFYDVTIITAEHGRFILKAGRSPDLIDELSAEFRVLEALRAVNAPAPRPVAWAQRGEEGLFLFTCLEGENLLTALERADQAGRHRLVASWGRALRSVHGWAPPLARPERWLESALVHLARRLDQGELENPIRHGGRFGGSDPAVVLAELQRWAPGAVEILAFTHGDFCVPNALTDGTEVTAVIDWSGGAYRDLRIDLAAAAFSIRRNLRHEEYVSTFLQAYGYEEPAESLRPFEALWVLL